MSNYILRKLPEPLWSQVKQIAAKEGTPLRAMFLDLLQVYVDDYEVRSAWPEPPTTICDVCGKTIGTWESPIYHREIRRDEISISYDPNHHYCLVCLPPAEQVTREEANVIQGR